MNTIHVDDFVIPTWNKTVKALFTEEFTSYLAKLDRSQAVKLPFSFFKEGRKAYDPRTKTDFFAMKNPTTWDKVIVFKKKDAVHRYYSNEKLMAV